MYSDSPIKWSILLYIETGSFKLACKQTGEIWKIVCKKKQLIELRFSASFISSSVNISGGEV